MEQVGGRGLLRPPPPLHLLNDLQDHADRGGEADQEEQVCREKHERGQEARGPESSVRSQESGARSP